MRYTEINETEEDDVLQEMTAGELVNHFKSTYRITKKVVDPNRAKQIKETFELPVTHKAKNGPAIARMPDDIIGLLEWPAVGGYVLGVDSNATMEQVKRTLGWAKFGQ